MSSSKTTTTFGAPFGALTPKRGGALALRASSSVIVGGLGSGTGRTVRLTSCAANGSGSKLNIPISTDTTGESFFGISDFTMVVLFSFLSLSECLVLVRRQG